MNIFIKTTKYGKNPFSAYLETVSQSYHRRILGSVKKFVSLEENDSFLVRITI